MNTLSIKTFILVYLLLLLALPSFAANPQLVKGGAAVTVPLSLGQGYGGLTNTFSVMTYSAGTFGAAVSGFANISLASLPVTVNGLTISSAVGGAPYTSVTLQASSACTLPVQLGLYMCTTASSGQPNSGPCDVTAGAAPVAAPTVSSVTVSPVSVPATTGQIVTLTAVLSGPAPSGGATVTPSFTSAGGWSGNLQFASTFNIAAGASSGSTPVTLNSTATGTVSLICSYNSSSSSATVTVGTAAAGTTPAATGAPGVSASLSPYVIAAGGSSVLRWDTSGASSVTVTGVSAPSMGGTFNVSPASTTTYTVTATNSAGTTTQTVTLTVGGPNAPGGAGVSSFTGANTAPVINAGGFQAPVLPSIPGLTLPAITLPSFTVPTLTIPSLPGDLSIGIPGIGSIGIPTNWLTQILTYASTAASVATGMTGTILTSGMQYAAYTTNLAVAGVDTDLKNGTAILHGDAVTTTQTIHNEQTIATQVAYDAQVKTQGIISSSASATQSVINASALSTQNVITTTETKSVVDFRGMLSDLLSYLFIPDPSVLDQFKAEQGQFLNWGPYSFITSFQALLSAPPGDGKVGGVMLGVPSLDVNADASTSYTIDPATGNITGGQPGFSYFVTPNAAPIPFDFGQVTSLPGWAFVRLLLGAGVWVLFVTGVMRVVQPKQVL